MQKDKPVDNKKIQNGAEPLIRDRIIGIDSMVPVLDGGSHRYVYFDNAASTPPIQDVFDCVSGFLPWYSSVHRGSGFKSRIATKAYDDARRAVGRFFGADDDQHVVIFGKNTTEAVNKLSYRLGLAKKDVVIISMMEHHSNDLPWRKISTVIRAGIDEQGRLNEKELDDLLDRYAGRVKLVAISGGSNVTGFMPDIHKIAEKAHRAGALIMVDCAQLAPHRKIDIKDLSDPRHLDFITISAHKMYAPFGTGALIGRRDVFKTGAPEICGGGTIDVVTDETVEWATPPDRDEAGTPNIVGAIALAKSLEILSKLGMEDIARHEAELTAYALERMNKIENINILGDKDPRSAHERLGVIPFEIKSLPSGLVAAILGAEYGIGVRSGCFCAHPYVTRLMKVSDAAVEKFRLEVKAGDKSHLPGVVRVSFGMYNTTGEIDYLVSALKNIAKGDHSRDYKLDKKTGDYYPTHWNPDLSKSFSLNSFVK